MRRSRAREEDSRVLVLIPAYGRHYESAEAAIADWNAGKDFRSLNGPYTSNREWKHIRNAGFSAVRLAWQHSPLQLTPPIYPAEDLQ